MDKKIRREHIENKKCVAIWGNKGRAWLINRKYFETSLDIAYLIDINNTEIELADSKILLPKDINKKNIDFIIIFISREDARKEVSGYLREIGVEYCFYEDLIDEYRYLWGEKELTYVKDRDNESVSASNGYVKLIDCYFPFQICNLRCSYCYVHMNNKRDYQHKYYFSIEYMLEAFSQRRVGGSALFWISGDGEPLMMRDMISFISGLLREGHYVILLTNGINSRSIDRLIDLSVELKKRLMIKFSWHFLENRRMNIEKVFLENIKKIRKCGISFTVSLVSSDEYIEYIDEIKKISLENFGAFTHVSLAIDYTNNANRPLVKENNLTKWSEFQSLALNNLDYATIDPMNYCEAGLKTIRINPVTGDSYRCTRGNYIGNIYEDLRKPIQFWEDVKPCCQSFCGCEPAYLSQGIMKKKNNPNLYERFNRTSNETGDWIKEHMKFALEKGLQ